MEGERKMNCNNPRCNKEIKSNEGIEIMGLLLMGNEYYCLDCARKYYSGTRITDTNKTVMDMLGIDPMIELLEHHDPITETSE